MCKHMVDGNEQKGHGKTTAVSEDAEAEIFITFKWKQYICARHSIFIHYSSFVPFPFQIFHTLLKCPRKK